MFWCGVVVLSVLLTTIAGSRPSYILPCSRTHDFETCALKHAKYAIPILVNGDKKLKIPSMNPLIIPLVDLKGTNSFNLKLNNLEIYGLENTVPIKIWADFDARKVGLTCKVDRITILADYVMNGKLLMFPITGNGRVNMTLYGGIYQYDFQYELQNRNGRNYAKIVDSAYDYKLENLHYDFQNLFNGDKLLGPQINKFLNENWQLVNEELKKPVLETLLVFHNDILRKISSQVPYNELFLD